MTILNDSAVVERVGAILVDATKDPQSATKFKSSFTPATGNIVQDLNEYWRKQLMTVKADTTSERTCLVGDATPEVWLGLFTKHIVPTVSRFGLPNGDL